MESKQYKMSLQRLSLQTDIIIVKLSTEKE